MTTITTSISVQSPAFNPTLQLPNNLHFSPPVKPMTNTSAPFNPSVLAHHINSSSFIPNFSYTDNQQIMLPSTKAKPFSFAEFEQQSGAYSYSTRISLGSMSHDSELSDFDENEMSPKMSKATSLVTKSDEVQPIQWKAKVRTELCKFWLRG
jgi:hypothetical protein